MSSLRLSSFTRIFMIILMITVTSFSGIAQVVNNKASSTWNKNIDLQLSIGATQFYGDVSSHNYFQKWKGESPLGFQVNARKMMSPTFGFGLNLYYTGISSIKDRKADGTRVDFALTGNYYSFTPFAYLNINNFIFGYKADRKLSMYATLGIGYSLWKTRLLNRITGITVYSGTTIGTYKYKTQAVSIPAGLGLDYKINQKWSVHLGGQFTTVMSDDVDIWHDGFKYDQLFYTQVGITYHINRTWGKNLLGKTSKKKDKECCEKKKVKKPYIPLYDYMVITPVKKETQVNTPKTVELLPIKKQKPVSHKNTFIPKKKSSEVDFRIQILATSKRMNNPNILVSRYHLPYSVEESLQNGLYRYTVGHFSNYRQAVAEANRIQSLGIRDAFVTVYRNGLRIMLINSMK